jgi:2-polyprenyl-6-methoxyphenol hydroxylase-like FAD-dependent oxidoreductase
MTEQRVHKALIIGGSLAGLFTATALRAIGWQVEVYERSWVALNHLDGGVVLLHDIIEALKFSGVDTADQLGVRSNFRTYLDQPGDIRHKQLAPQLQTSWNALYSNLLKVLPAENYHLGKQFVGVDQRDDGVTAHFEDGSSAEADLLIGADGGDSTVRGLVLPGVSPVYAGYVVWLGLAKEGDLPKEAKDQLHEDFVFQQDPESMMLAYMVPGADGSTVVGERRFFWAWYLKAAPGKELDAVLTDHHGHRNVSALAPGAMTKEQDAKFRKIAEERINPAFLELIRHTDDVFVQAIRDLKVRQMVFNRVMLIADAAFIPRPHTAGVIAKAAEYALSLARQLTQHPDMDEGLRRWEQHQLKEGTTMSAWGIDMGNRIMGIGEYAGLRK